MEQTNALSSHIDFAKNLINEGNDNNAIIIQLKKKGLDDVHVEEVMKEVKRFRNARRTRLGSLLVLIGVIILGAGAISTIIIHMYDGSVGFSLYGLTGIGFVILMTGLVMIFS